MTFSEIKTAIKDLCNLTSTDADTRVGKSVNRHYKRITASLGLDPTRFVTRNASTSAGVQTVTFTSIEKIDRIIDATDSTAIRELTPVSVDEIRTQQPGTGQPARWAEQSVTASSVTILLDTLPQDTYSLQADGRATVSDLSGSDVPAIAESYHDILTFLVVAEELLKKEKPGLAKEYASGDEERPGRAEKLLQAYRFELADAPPIDFRQGGRVTTGGSTAGGGSGNVGGTAYTQTALVTFDRDPAAPFAVSASSAAVTNLDADLLDGQHGSYYRDAGNLNAGTLPDARFPATLPVASGVNLTALNASNLASGTVPDARFPATLPAASGANLTALAATAGASVVLLKANSGTTTTTSAENVDTVAISGLTAKDTLWVVVNASAVTQQCASLIVRNNTDGITMIPFAGTAIAAGAGRIGQGFARQGQSGATAVETWGVGHTFANTNDSVVGRNLTFTTNWTGAWTLALQQGGMTSGGTLKWAWAVYKLAGQ